MATVLNTSAPYCGPEYAGENCAYYAQLTPGLTGNAESIPNTICAFQKDGKQYACDPGCCGIPPLPVVPPSAGDVSEEGFPLWAIILIIVLGFLGIICLIKFNGSRVRLHGGS